MQKDEISKNQNIKSISMYDEMSSSYLSYAMSVIVSRGLPDVRDGLKPVQRRILYVMADLGLRPATPFRKSAGVVGEVMGKYHPHGDGAIYEAMVRLGQSFSMSVPFVDPKGNFGSPEAITQSSDQSTSLPSCGFEVHVDISHKQF